MSFKQGDIVWVVRSPLPNWPAKIVSKKKGKGNPVYQVQYFCDNPKMEIEEKYIYDFQEHLEQFQPTDEIIKKHKKLGKAMDEVRIYLDNKCSQNKKVKDPIKKLKIQEQGDQKRNNFMKEIKTEEKKIVENSKERRKTNSISESPTQKGNQNKQINKKISKPTSQKIIASFSKPKQVHPIVQIQMILQTIFFEGVSKFTDPEYSSKTKQKLNQAFTLLDQLKDVNASNFFNTSICRLMNYFRHNLDPIYFEQQRSQLQKWIDLINDIVIKNLNSTTILENIMKKSHLAKSSQKETQQKVKDDKGASTDVQRVKEQIQSYLQNKLKPLKLQYSQFVSLKQKLQEHLSKTKASQFEIRWKELKGKIQKLQNFQSEKDIKNLLFSV